MTSNALRVILCTAILGVISQQTLSDDKAKDNLLKNGGFEKAEANGLPSTWITGAEGGKADYKVITEKPKEGKNCLKIKGTVTWAAAFVKLPVDKNKTYTLSGYSRASSGTAIIKFDYFKGLEHLGQTVDQTVEAPEAEWKELTVKSELDQHPEATHIAVTVAALGEADCDFDALMLSAK